MDKFTKLTAKACPLDLPNVNTDQILPARFLKVPRSAELGRVLFHDLRRDADGAERPDFPLNRPIWRDAEILVAGRNFGGGSSREAAVYALCEAGIRCVIAPSFGDIFAENAVKNGLLAAILPESAARELSAAISAEPTRPVIVDLEQQDRRLRQPCFRLCNRSGEPQSIAQRLGRRRSDRELQGKDRRL